MELELLIGWELGGWNAPRRDGLEWIRDELIFRL